MKRLTIAIDGPAAAGKGTIARGIAKTLGYSYIDTGAMYRGVALMAKRKGVDWSADEELGRLAETLDFSFSFDDSVNRIWVGTEDVSEALREGDIGEGASRVSACPAVRKALLGQQRALGKRGGVVLDGRDIGTVVLPDADLKIFLTASVDERARRRFAEAYDRGDAITFEEVKSAIEIRDHRDSTREFAPLKMAKDAMHLDTTSLSINRAEQLVLNEVEHLLSD